MDDIPASLWRRLRPLLDRAIELQGEARRHYLDNLPGDDRALIGPLEQLLAKHAQLSTRTLSTAIALAVLALSEEERTQGIAYARRDSALSERIEFCVREIDDAVDAYLFDRRHRANDLPD